MSDSQAADSFFQALAAKSDNEVTRSESNGIITYTNPQDDNMTIVLHDDALLFTNDPSAAAGEMPASSLADSASFSSSFDMLPENDYTAEAFINLPAIVESLGSEIEAYPQLVDIAGAFGPQVWGASLLDDQSLLVDVAQAVSDVTALQKVGISASASPVDPDFARYIPANVALAGLGTDLSAQYDNAMAQLDLQKQLMQSMGPDSGDMADVQANIDQALGMFTDYTGLDLREDVFGWMTGSYAAFITLNPDMDFSNQFAIYQALPIDLGIVIEATNPAAASHTVDGLMKGLDRLLVPLAAQDDNADVSFTTETISGTEVNVITITSSQIPWPVELLLGSNDDIFVLGTRGAVTRVLQGDGMLNSSDVFARVQDNALDSYSALGFLDPSVLAPLTDLVELMGGSDASGPMSGVRAMLGLVHSLSVSQRITADTYNGRFVLALNS